MGLLPARDSIPPGSNLGKNVRLQLFNIARFRKVFSFQPEHGLIRYCSVHAYPAMHRMINPATIQLRSVDLAIIL
jgi:hypothetical protein